MCIELLEQYGTEAGTGGNTDWKSGSIALTASQVESVDKRLYASLKGLGAHQHQILVATLVEADLVL